MSSNLFKTIKNNLIDFCKSFNKNTQWERLSKNIYTSHVSEHTRIVGPCQISESSIDFGSYIATNAAISQTTIGKFCSIGPNFDAGRGIHPVNGISTSPAFYSTKGQAGFTYSKVDKIEERKRITIGNDVFIGGNVTVLDGVTIGDGAVIGAGAVVSKDIPPYAIAIGCPIKVVKYRFAPEIIEALLEIKWWNQDKEVLSDLEKNFFDVESFIKQHRNKNQQLSSE